MKSASPSIKGISGPTISRLIFLVSKASFICLKSETEISKLLAILAVPAFPGATYKLLMFFDSLIFEQNEC